MSRIWFRVGMETEVTEEEMKELLVYGGFKEGKVDDEKAHNIMRSIIKRAELSGETYLPSGADMLDARYDNPDDAIDFTF